ncbi:MAG TPA: hypothetical protein VNK26_00350, partial [Pyrinomonadaceae bacterium]|nr:hypothetical protein [Pyrinomonadaceae bacterium]
LSGLYLLSFNSGLNLAFDDNKGAFETSRQPSKASQTENTRTGAVPSASDPLNSGQIALSQNSQPAEQNNDQFQAPLADNSMPDSVNQVASSRSVDQNMASKTRYIKAGYRTGSNPVAENLPNSNSAAESEYLPSERTFLKTISDLEKSSSQKLSEMSPAEQFAFQRDMAVINDSITRLKGVLKKNPQNRSARQILYTAYQDKIDLLNSAAQRNELVATIK